MPVSLSSALPPKLPAPTAASKPQTAAKAVSTLSQKPPAGNAPSNAAGDVFVAAKKAASKPPVTITDTRTPLPESKPATKPSSVSATIDVGTKPAIGEKVGGKITAVTGQKSTKSVNQSGTVGDPNSTVRNKPNPQSQTSTNASGTIFSVSDKVFEGVSVGNDKVGASLGVEASYKAEASVGKDGLHVEIGGEVKSGFEAHASHTEGPATIGANLFIGGRAGAGVNVDVGPNGVDLGAHAEAFLGIEGSVYGGFQTDAASVQGTLTGQVGVGADAHADFQITPDGSVKYDFGAGIALGLGGKAGLSGELDIAEIAEDVKPYLEQAAEAAEPYLEAAESFAENTVETVENVTENAVETVENVAENAVEATEDVVEAAQDAGEAVLDFFF